MQDRRCGTATWYVSQWCHSWDMDLCGQGHLEGHGLLKAPGLVASSLGDDTILLILVRKHLSVLCFVSIWVRSENCGCLVTWFCFKIIAKSGNRTATVPWLDPYDKAQTSAALLQRCLSNFKATVPWPDPYDKAQTSAALLQRCLSNFKAVW